MIVVNMQKAKEIKKNLIRAERKQMLEELDVKMLRAVEQGDSEMQSIIAAKKQALRDATADQAIENASTPDELKAFVPAAFIM